MARNTPERRLWMIVGISPVGVTASRQTPMQPRVLRVMPLATAVAVKRHATSKATSQVSSAIRQDKRLGARVVLPAVGAGRRSPPSHVPPASGQSLTPDRHEQVADGKSAFFQITSQDAALPGSVGAKSL